MATIHQVRGVILEEAILALLRAAGYRTVTNDGSDPTLGTSSAGLTVAGRGSVHQIDAIADLRVGHPFSHPQRLLVEAKAYSDNRPIGLPIVRGAVGVLKDVSEYWVARSPGRPPVVRYHYQSAIFSTSRFTQEAQEYAFAHDIYLLPLRRSRYFRPVIQAIETAAGGLPVDDNDNVVGVDLRHLRTALRQRLQPDFQPPGNILREYGWLEAIVRAVGRLGFSLVATLGQSFHVFLTPSEEVELDELQDVEDVELHFSRGGTTAWTISRRAGSPLFTFDLPKELFELYADEGVLSRERALDLKEEYFGEFTAILATRDQVRMLNFRLDQNWFDDLRRNLREI